jgi:tRNA-specific 2-thiouridylase
VRVVVAMSGGVDSSVVAGLCVEQGHEVIGVHMKLHDHAASATHTEKRCCGYDDALDARKVADKLGIPFYVVNLKEAFQKAVIDDLVSNYVAGLTPNPCVQCNGVLKFQVLLARAVSLGADRLATGHYARIVDGQLHTARDAAKDQTYFLYPMSPKSLEKTWFPLGGLTKPEVRAHAARLGLITADKPESQEICFVADDDHARFVASQRPDLDGSGEIVDETGHVLGHHDAYWRYTVGQRRGLGLALGAPAYVVRIEPESRRVVIGFDRSIWHGALTARDPKWLGEVHEGTRVEARVRHRGTTVPATLFPAENHVRVVFDTPVRAAAPGQSVVFYQGERVLGGATITKAEAA